MYTYIHRLSLLLHERQGRLWLARKHAKHALVTCVHIGADWASERVASASYEPLRLASQLLAFKVIGSASF